MTEIKRIEEKVRDNLYYIEKEIGEKSSISILITCLLREAKNGRLPVIIIDTREDQCKVYIKHPKFQLGLKGEIPGVCPSEYQCMFPKCIKEQICSLIHYLDLINGAMAPHVPTADVIVDPGINNVRRHTFE